MQEPSGEKEGDDFEVVPQDQDDDTDMWDVEGENEDEVKQAKIKSGCLFKVHFYDFSNLPPQSTVWSPQKP